MSLCRSAMSMRCLAVMCHAPAPPHHRLIPRAKSCRTLCPNSTSPTLGNRTSDPDALSILSLPTFHHSPAALAVPLLFPHRPSPILATFLSMACVLKRFSLTSPRKLSLACVKLGFLRTSRTHLTSQLSPCAPLCRSAMSMRCRAGTINAPTPSHRRLLPRANSCLALFPNPQLPPCAIAHLTPYPLSSSLHSLSITLPKHLTSLRRFHTGPLQF